MRWFHTVLVVVLVLTKGSASLTSSKSVHKGSMPGKQQQTRSTSLQHDDASLGSIQSADILPQSDYEDDEPDCQCNICKAARGEDSTDNGQCVHCTYALYADPESVAYPASTSSACRTCLTASSDSVEWTSKDYLARQIAKVMLRDYLGQLPPTPQKEDYPCVGCMLFLLENHESKNNVYQSGLDLSKCSQCLEDPKVKEDVHTFVN